MKTYSAWPFEGLKQTLARFVFSRPTMWLPLLILAGACRRASLLTSADHEERLHRAPGAGRRCPLLGRAGPSQTKAGLQPGNLYPPSFGWFLKRRMSPSRPKRRVFLTSWRQTSDCLKPRGKTNWTRWRIWWSWTTSTSSTRSLTSCSKGFSR